ncbi:hypothetical protein [Pseudomonas koreensis]|uniref:hypothetical protein n=1 Tax=Pseudomonas koreensis TaxID=198620 RepID=UPI0009F50FD4|nr:hypothetical protein [Pseudomonas koreensis]KAB0514215.1 hypothetical protein F7R05_08140 [Pseudomonas koreensis]NNA62573.1 hypothetical protein [Pseudomonas koreensis]GGK29370.1 hypothetical protein GCM10009103_25430 [Pseudomonas koreensis]
MGDGIGNVRELKARHRIVRDLYLQQFSVLGEQKEILLAQPEWTGKLHEFGAPDQLAKHGSAGTVGLLELAVFNQADQNLTDIRALVCTLGDSRRWRV